MLTSTTESFIQNDLELDTETKSVKVSQIFKWYANDFGQNDEEVIEFIAKFIPENHPLKKWLSQKQQVSLTYSNSNWDSNNRGYGEEQLEVSFLEPSEVEQSPKQQVLKARTKMASRSYSANLVHQVKRRPQSQNINKHPNLQLDFDTLPQVKCRPKSSPRPLVPITPQPQIFSVQQPNVPPPPHEPNLRNRNDSQQFTRGSKPQTFQLVQSSPTPPSTHSKSTPSSPRKIIRPSGDGNSNTDDHSNLPTTNSTPRIDTSSESSYESSPRTPDGDEEDNSVEQENIQENDTNGVDLSS